MPQGTVTERIKLKEKVAYGLGDVASITIGCLWKPGTGKIATDLGAV
jgi:hypothetical protein